MMPVCRLGDTGMGHGCFPSTNTTKASRNVIINGLGACREGDSLAPHSCPDNGTHGRSISSGSSTVKVNGVGIARVLVDKIDCGGFIISGSPNVLAG